MTASTNAGESLQRIEPRQLSVRALRQHGYGKICRGEPRDYVTRGSLLSTILFISILISLAVFAFVELKWSLWTSALSVAFTLFVCLVLTLTKIISIKTNYFLFLAVWMTAALYQILARDFSSLALTHGLPFLITVLGRWSWRSLNLAARVPLFVPVIFIVVLAPLLTEDPWRLAHEAGGRIAILGLVALVPLLAAVVARVLRVKMTDFFDPGPIRDQVDSLVDQGLKRFTKLTHATESFDADSARRYLESAYIKYAEEQSFTLVEKKVSRQFRHRAATRLIGVFAGMLIATFLLLYILAAAAMPSSLASDWANSGESTMRVEVIGSMISVPIGPYLEVAALFSIVATAGFMAFTLTEEKYLASVVDSVIGRSAKECTILSIPFIFNDPHEALPSSQSADAESVSKSEVNRSRKRRQRR